MPLPTLSLKCLDEILDQFLIFILIYDGGEITLNVRPVRLLVLTIRMTGGGHNVAKLQWYLSCVSEPGRLFCITTYATIGPL